MRIGLISDTHLPSLVRSLDEMGPEIGQFLATVDLILHGGDVTAPSILDWCQQFAPVVVAKGNNDAFHDERMKDLQFLDVHGWRIGMVHDLRPESRPVETLITDCLGGERVDILIGGDTHVDRLEFRDGVVVVNSGSPTFPHHKSTRLGTGAVLELGPGRIHAEIVVFGQTEGLRNPGMHRGIHIEDHALVATAADGIWSVIEEVDADM